MLLTLCNGLVGLLCGMRFRVQVLVPLIVIAVVEVAIVSRTETWWSAIWLAIALIAAIEVGYLAGAAAVALWSASTRKALSPDFVAYRHKGLSPH